MSILNRQMGNCTLSKEFHEELEYLKSKCSVFIWIQNKLNELLWNSDDEQDDLNCLLKLHEYMVPSYSLDILTSLIQATLSTSNSKLLEQKETKNICRI